MYIIKVFIEHPFQALDTTFDYLSYEKIPNHIRVVVPFQKRKIVGYVDDVVYTSLTKDELEAQAGFTYQFIIDAMDDQPLLNDELHQLAYTLSKLTLSPRIACIQAMIPCQLKPTTHKKVPIKTTKIIHIIQYNQAKTAKQQECFDYIKNHPSCLLKEVPYSQAVVRKLVEQGLIEIVEKEVYRIPRVSLKKKDEVVLTLEQQAVVDDILSKKERVSLIHGVTGSGKTEVYLALAKQVLKQGQTVIMLVPEIALTPMMVDIFKQRFLDQVAIIHSRLSAGERYDEYRRIQRQEVKIVVGVRSAIFVPLENIGLIILDEEHDSSYKQDKSPRYLTTQIAKIRAQYHHARVVLGSATPSLESYSRALKGVYDLYTLPHRINQKPLPQIQLVDMVQEMKSGNYSLFSNEMKEAIKQTLQRDEQVILLLNKRGYATYVRCQDCGEVLKCPHCDVTLTYHKEDQQLKCHYCDYHQPLNSVCPTCGGQTFKTYGYGTQKVVELLEQMFPDVTVIRYDMDTTRGKNAHQDLLKRFENKEAQILLGTQMIAKGLDFENVTFVGVLNADMTLNVPDFRASERTFQLLCQVAGRSGRGAKSGHVIIQTYNPDHYAIQCAMHHDYDTFYKQEMQYRQHALYPPFCHLVSLLVQGHKEDDVIACANDIKEYLVRHLHHGQVLGPADSAIYKLDDFYRQRLLIKFSNSQLIYQTLDNLRLMNQKQRKVTVICDFNPYTQI